MSRWVIVCPAFRHSHGVLDYSCRLAQELVRHGIDVTLVTRYPRHLDGVANLCWPHWRPAAVLRLAAAIATREPAVAVLQYVPQMYGRRGLSAIPTLLAKALAAHNVPVELMVHEAYVPWGWDAAHAGVATAQRLMLASTALSCQGVWASTQRLAGVLQRWGKPLRRSIQYMPVGSNIPIAAAPPMVLGAGPKLMFFGSLHDSKQFQWAVAAAASVGAPLYALGPSLPDTPVKASGSSGQIVPLGHLEEREASRCLAAADLVLLPYSEGVSARRGSAMAAWAHGRAVVSTVGSETDDVIRRSPGLTLTPAHDREAFVREAARLASDAGERQRVGDAGRALYEREFDWPVLVRRYLGVDTARPLARAA